MTIAIIVEGKTERAFLPILRQFLESSLAGNMPRLDPFPQDGRIPKEDKLRRVVQNLLQRADAVIALTDVYTGTQDFTDAADAKAKMKSWVGAEPNFFPHAAQHDFEAWLIPYWAEIQKLAGHNRSRPPGNPELVNHSRPPSQYIKEIFRSGTHGRDYVKDRDALRILKGKDLMVAINECQELKAVLNTVLTLCGAPPL